MKVFKKAKDLIDHTFMMTDNTKRFSKKRRFTFVDRMQGLTLDIYKKLSKINEYPVKDRRKLQIDVLGDLNVLLALIDISLGRGFIDEGEAERWTNKVLLIQSMDKLYFSIFEGDG